ncbi:DUF2388 domain-containing protein [Pseudomonas purpurea]|uniref:DUF2388 domain-containing protein n=1 Tax=Pseudomonas purpurea TaxID=3136737 RepID=UPI003263586B
MYKAITLMLFGLSFSLPASAGDGGVQVSTFGGIVSTTLAVTLYPITFTDESSGNTRESINSHDQKIVCARNDAAAFVASNGNIRGVHLEAAFDVLRPSGEVDTVNDMRLAQAILVYQSR